MLDGKRILVTGGTGSLGQVLVRRLLSGSVGTPEKVIVLSRDEGKQHDMRMRYQNRSVTTDEVIYRNFLELLEFRIGDVRSVADMCSAVQDVDIVVNAAALKQVPTCEYFPGQAILTNCMGAVSIVRAIRETTNHVATVVGVSTDKACKPVNVMGMTKALQERIFTSANLLIPDTRFICVRYGNVLASRGSVIPLFREQIRTGGPVTLTVPDMTRFLLSLDQAVDTIIAALEGGKRGETYIPCSPSATVENIATALVGDRDIEIRTIGIRPGEKMHEILVSEEERHHTERRGDYLAIFSMLPELQQDGPDKKNGLTKEFSSADQVVDLAGTIEILKKHDLMLEQEDAKAGETGELLR